MKVVLAILILGTGCMGTSGAGDVDASTGDGHVAPHDGSGNNPDGSNPDGSNGLTCKNGVTSGLVSGHHNAGLDCMSGCHNHGFTLAGTLYNASGQAQRGGSITVKQANGQSFDMVSGNNGNFYTTQSVSFPVTLVASDCPSAVAMTATMTGSQGCNSNACHGGSQGPVHL